MTIKFACPTLYSNEALVLYHELQLITLFAFVLSRMESTREVG
jgi:hypothetical protein